MQRQSVLLMHGNSARHGMERTVARIPVWWFVPAFPVLSRRWTPTDRDQGTDEYTLLKYQG
jgi:hypothetical protein